MQINLVVDESDHLQAYPIDDEGNQIADAVELPPGIYRGTEISLGEFNEGLKSGIAVSHIIEYNGQRLAVQIAAFEDDDMLFG